MVARNVAIARLAMLLYWLASAPMALTHHHHDLHTQLQTAIIVLDPSYLTTGCFRTEQSLSCCAKKIPRAPFEAMSVIEASIVAPDQESKKFTFDVIGYGSEADRLKDLIRGLGECREHSNAVLTELIQSAPASQQSGKVVAEDDEDSDGEGLILSSVFIHWCSVVQSATIALPD
jgi:hypothetical protein